MLTEKRNFQKKAIKIQLPEYHASVEDARARLEKWLKGQGETEKPRYAGK